MYTVIDALPVFWLVELSTALTFMVWAPPEMPLTFMLAVHVVVPRHDALKTPSKKISICFTPLASDAETEILKLPFLGSVAPSTGLYIVIVGGVVSDS